MYDEQAPARLALSTYFRQTADQPLTYRASYEGNVAFARFEALDTAVGTELIVMPNAIGSNWLAITASDEHGHHLSDTLLVTVEDDCPDTPAGLEDYFPLPPPPLSVFDYQGSYDSDYEAYLDRGVLTISRSEGSCSGFILRYELSHSFDGERSSRNDVTGTYGPYYPLNWMETSTLSFDGSDVRVDFDGKPNPGGTCNSNDCHMPLPRFASPAALDVLTFEGYSGVCQYRLDLTRHTGPTFYMQGCYGSGASGSSYTITRTN